MIEINLVPDVKQQLLRAQSIRSTVIAVSVMIGAASIVAVSLLAAYVFMVQTVREGVADNNIKSGYAKYSSVKDLSKILTIQNQLTKISDQHAEKEINSRLFDVITAIIPPSPNEVYISSLILNPSERSVTIEGQSPNSFVALEVFKKTVDGTKVKYIGDDGKETTAPLTSNVTTGDTSYGEDEGGNKVLRFTLRFTYAEELVSSTLKNVSVISADKGNVTDSYLGIPRFVERASDLPKENK
jgi:hypothetical protein